MPLFFPALVRPLAPGDYDSYDSYGESTMDPAAALGLMLLMMGIYAIIIAVALLASGFSWAGVFSKAGYPKWAAFVPFYNSWIIVKISGRPASSFWLQFIPYAGVYWAIVSLNDLAKSFGKDAAYTVGLVFVPVVFASILSYGDARYLGPAYMSPEQKMYMQQYGQQYAQPQYAPQYAQQPGDGSGPAQQP